MANTAKKQRLPARFKHLMWSYKFSKIQPDKHRERIIINTINYGEWHHLKWIADYFGKKKLKEIVKNIPVSEFRNKAGLELICLLLNIKKMKYATRGLKIKTKRTV